MYGNDDQQTQTTNPVSGFSSDNFTPPAALTNAPLSDTPVANPAPAMASTTDNMASTAPSVPASANPLDTPELPSSGTPDPVAASDTPLPDGILNAPLDDAPTDNPLPANDDELLSLKQQALQQLTPLVDQLDQTPEEKFRTTMMMIQASDDQSLLKTAYDAAQAIADEKERAQALLDVINEINYFTQHAQVK